MMLSLQARLGVSTGAPNGIRGRVHSTRVGRLSTARVMAAVNVEQIQKGRSLIREIIRETHANPIFVRLAWHDSGSYDDNVKQGGATASIRFKPELGYGANNGLKDALDLLEPVKAACPDVSYADIIQLASAEGIGMAASAAGRQLEIPLRFGRVDATGPEDCTPDGRLPAAAAPFPDKAPKPADHLRNVFHRMGLTDQDIVALSGAHTLGRARPSRSGFGSEEGTKYTRNGPGKPGGTSWTPEWLKFDNTYFAEIKEKRDAELLVLETDAALFEDPGFAPFAEKYAASNEAFFQDYVVSHLKLSELGCTWDGEPTTVPADPLEAFCESDPSADECRVYED